MVLHHHKQRSSVKVTSHSKTPLPAQWKGSGPQNLPHRQYFQIRITLSLPPPTREAVLHALLSYPEWSPACTPIDSWPTLCAGAAGAWLLPGEHPRVLPGPRPRRRAAPTHLAIRLPSWHLLVDFNKLGTNDFRAQIYTGFYPEKIVVR